MSLNKSVIFLLVVIAILLGVIILLLTNQGQEVSESPTPAIPTIISTVWITPAVTYIVATVPSPVPTQIPSSTPLPTSTLEWDPFSVAFYFPLPECAASRLHKGDMSFVGNLDRTIKISLSDQVFADPGVRNLVLGEFLHITGNPVCERNTVIWPVRAVSDNVVGYVPEGDGDTYWLFPAAPSIPTPRRLRP